MFTRRCGTKCFRLDQWCDERQDCEDNSDEGTCGRKHKVINMNPVLNWPKPADVNFDDKGYVELIFQSDTATTFECFDSHFKCPSDNMTCVPVFVRCNGVHDCPGHEDEESCDSYTCPGLYRCRASTVCVPPVNLCDGTPHCPRDDDELMCDFFCPDNCVCHGWAFTCRDSVVQTRNLPQLRYLDVSGTGMTPLLLEHNTLLIYLSLANCLLEYLANLTLPNLHTLDLSDNQLTSVYGDHFSGVPLLRVLFLAWNPLTSIFPVRTSTSPFTLQSPHVPDLSLLDLSGVEMKTFNRNILVFADLQTLNLSGCGVEEVLNDGFQSLNNLRLLDLRGCPLHHFPKGLFVGLDRLENIHADSYKVCCPDIVPFNLEGCSAPDDVVSSCTSLLRSNVHRVCVSVFASLALVGNVGSLVARAWIKRQSQHPVSSHAVFVTHLSLSDCVMGLYLAMIGVVDRLYQGNYLWEDTAWRNGVACQVAGFLAVLSSQVSALVVALITLDRLLAIHFPSSRSLSLSGGSAQLACAATWIVAFILASLPLVPHLSDGRVFTRTAICSPLPLTPTDRGGQRFADGLLVLPSVAVASIIAVGQVFVYVAIKSNPFAFLDTAKHTRELTIARRLLTTVVCKCLCWLILGTVRLLASRATPMSDDVHVGVALLLLPLSAALDPYLYVFGIVQQSRRQAREQRLLKRLRAKKVDKGQGQSNVK